MSGMHADELRKILSYCPETGVFLWRHRDDVPKEWNTRRAGKVAGSVMVIGYRMIRINGTDYLAHRLAWLYITLDKKRRHLGFYTSVDEAKAAYDEAAHELFGEYACVG